MRKEEAEEGQSDVMWDKLNWLLWLWKCREGAMSQECEHF